MRVLPVLGRLGVSQASVPIRPKYTPTLSRVERAAYAAAHRILTETSHHPELACPGARRSRQADDIARIIVESIGGR